MTIHLRDRAATRALAGVLGQLVRPGDFVALRGGLGVGKTQLVRDFMAAIGSNGRVTSPTFAVVNEYESPIGPIRHVDAYRLSGVAEAEERGLVELLDDSTVVVLCEWPELLGELVPPHALWLSLTRADAEPGADTSDAPRELQVRGTDLASALSVALSGIGLRDVSARTASPSEQGLS